MRKLLPIRLAIAACAAVALASCASPAKPAAAPQAPAAQAAPAPAAPEKTAKQRSVVVKVPVLAKESSFYADGLLDEYTIYKYDETKTRLLERATYDASRPDPIERILSEWKDGRLAAETAFDAEGKVKQRREFVYGASGALVSERALDAKGAAQSSSAYAYDAAGRKTEWKAFDGSGSLKAQTLYSDKAIEMRDAGGRKTGSIAIESLPDGRVAKRSYLAADGSLQKYESYAYAEGPGPVSVETRRADGSLASRTTCSYGAAGELLSSRTVDGSGIVRDSRSFEYSFREDSKVETYYE